MKKKETRRQEKEAGRKGNKKRIYEKEKERREKRSTNRNEKEVEIA